MGVALAFLPAAVMVSSIGFFVVPSLLAAASMSVSDNAFNYSINQSAREALYVPTSKNAKYKAKAFIDMFVQRLAKVASVALNLGFSIAIVSGVRWLSIVTLVMVIAWLFLVRYVSRGFRRAERAEAVREAIADS